MKRRPCWCPKPILWELNSFLMQTLSLVPINLHRCWPREWKHSITKEPWGLVAWARRGRRGRGDGEKEKEEEEEEGGKGRGEEGGGGGEGKRRRRRRRRRRRGGEEEKEEEEEEEKEEKEGRVGGVEERGLIPEQLLLIESTLKSDTVKLTAVSFSSSTWISTNMSGSSAFKIAK